MMNFEALSHAGKEAKELQEDSEQKWLDLLLQAQAQIRQFHQFGFAELLPQASQSLLTIHEQKPSWAEPLAWLAYILFLQKQDHLAQQYIDSALSRQAEQPLALRLQQALADVVQTDTNEPDLQLRSIRRLSFGS